MSNFSSLQRFNFDRALASLPSFGDGSRHLTPSPTALTLNVRPCFPSSHHQDVGPCLPLLPAHLRTELSDLFAQSLPVVPEYQIRSWKRARVLNTACSVRVPFGLFCSILRFDEGIFYFALFRVRHGCGMPLPVSVVFGYRSAHSTRK